MLLLRKKSNQLLSFLVKKDENKRDIGNINYGFYKGHRSKGHYEHIKNLDLFRLQMIGL